MKNHKVLSIIGNIQMIIMTIVLAVFSFQDTKGIDYTTLFLAGVCLIIVIFNLIGLMLVSRIGASIWFLAYIIMLIVSAKGLIKSNMTIGKATVMDLIASFITICFFASMILLICVYKSAYMNRFFLFLPIIIQVINICLTCVILINRYNNVWGGNNFGDFFLREGIGMILYSTLMIFIYTAFTFSIVFNTKNKESIYVNTDISLR